MAGPNEWKQTSLRSSDRARALTTLTRAGAFELAPTSPQLATLPLSAYAQGYGARRFNFGLATMLAHGSPGPLGPRQTILAAGVTRVGVGADAGGGGLYGSDVPGESKVASKLPLYLLYIVIAGVVYYVGYKLIASFWASGSGKRVDYLVR